MSTFAIGDIHGCWDALETLLEQAPISQDDQLITLGDYIDRGPDSARVLQWVIDEYELGRCVPLRGNHEVMMLASLEGQMNSVHWLTCGGQQTLESYRPSEQKREPNFQDVPTDHILFMKHQLKPYFETDTHLFVHASVYHGSSLEEQNEHTLYWDRFDYIGPHISGKIVVCGHTSQKSGQPANRGHAICLDTWVYGRGWLTCLELETGQYWQANQEKQFRTDWLEQPN